MTEQAQEQPAGKIRVVVPDGMTFTDLKLARDAETGAISFDLEAVRAVCVATGVDADAVLAHEGNVNSLIVAWYGVHRLDGGEPDLVFEGLIADAKRASGELQ
ncbi:hypothetical protein [Derxia gummosa]|uniref:Uncharacterized protein n=1 Tax=Derxia gummosa DSM 723 TaxID=1121388 RepID=A0A8B6XAG3_9BURK|nr:hypothetical protein [Derxia gummosa]